MMALFGITDSESSSSEVQAQSFDEENGQDTDDERRATNSDAMIAAPDAAAGSSERSRQRLFYRVLLRT
eukprot:8190405-Pyramimonas_sp.AAC.1